MASFLLVSQSLAGSGIVPVILSIHCGPSRPIRSSIGITSFRFTQPKVYAVVFPEPAALDRLWRLILCWQIENECGGEDYHAWGKWARCGVEALQPGWDSGRMGVTRRKLRRLLTSESSEHTNSFKAAVTLRVFPFHF